MGRGGERQLTAGPEHAARLGEKQLHVAHMLDRLGAEDEVEVVVGERERLVRREQDRLGFRQPPPRPLQRHLGHVRRHQLRRVELGREPAVAGAEVERPLAAAEPAHELGQRGVRRPGSSGTRRQISSS